ncbi:hypothetical protein VTI28DRAFT_7724 [Corynascus sepedonium]
MGCLHSKRPNGCGPFTAPFTPRFAVNSISETRRVFPLSSRSPDRSLGQRLPAGDIALQSTLLHFKGRHSTDVHYVGAAVVSAS